MRKAWPATALGLLAATAAAAEPAVGTSGSAAETSVRYSAFVAPTAGVLLHGWQASLRPAADGRLSVVLDGAGYYASDGFSVHVLTAGPRLSRELGAGNAVFVQVLAGAAAFTAEDGFALLAVVQPGAGLDLASRSRVGLRLQADWPLVTSGGVTGAVPRLSAGIVWRP